MRGVAWAWPTGVGLASWLQRQAACARMPRKAGGWGGQARLAAEVWAWSCWHHGQDPPGFIFTTLTSNLHCTADANWLIFGRGGF